ncbi:hypothetical protein ALC60_12559 [Trachymyrmex zeteki]|uniref:Uncharacterized protein n=1 Tax=Mycetomoellerius zeteki TaxID=64791 RepID=A0A151WKR0_9HYME|nr:hypothetical protein ALC60_12559 [Trachymyrmex zeteki]
MLYTSKLDCSHQLSDSDNNLNVSSQNQSEGNIISNLNIVNNYNEDNSSQLIDEVDNVDSTDEINNIESEREIDNLESDNEIENFELTDNSEPADQIENENQNLKNFKKFKEDLGIWSIECNIPQTVLSKLLIILHKHTDYPFNTKLNPREIEYHYFGLERALNMILDEHIKYGGLINTLDILVNIDGLPIYKSGVSSLWLILCSSTVVKSVYVVDAFVMEKKIEIKLHALVCDAPAKSFILGVKNHNGYYSCTKCTIEGKYVNGRVCFSIKDTNPSLRTDEDFLNNKYEDYQIVETILSKIPKFGPITDVPLDYMHLVCLGVMTNIKLLRKPDKPLQQLARRYAEIETLPLSVQSCRIQSNINFRKPHNSGPLIDGYNFTAQFKILENDLYSINCDNERNNCVLLNNGDVVLIFNLVQSNDNNKFIIGKKLRYLDNLYSSPCASSTFNIQIVKIQNQLQIWPCDKLQAKMWIISLFK